MAALSENALNKRIQLWQERLWRLGIGHWQIKAKVVDEFKPLPDEDVDDAQTGARVVIEDHYDSARIEFMRSELDRADLDLYIVHELIHVAWRDLDRAVEDTTPHFSDHAWDAFEARYNHEREGLVERLARLMYDLFQE